MGLTKKFTIHVDEINEADEVIYVIGHEQLQNGEISGVKYEAKFDFAWLQIMLGDNGFNEIKQLGRLFYFYEGDKSRIDLPFFEPLSEEEKESIKKKAEYWAENIKEE